MWFQGLLVLVSLLDHASALTAASPRVQKLDHDSDALAQRLDGKLQQLRAAALAAGPSGVERFEELFPALLAEVEVGTAPPSPKQAKGGLNLKGERSVGNSNETGVIGGVASYATYVAQSPCIFDDALFSLSQETKDQLKGELSDQAMVGQIQFVRRGGWYSCAVADRTYPVDCKCWGNVRLVDVDRQQVSTSLINGATMGGVVSCQSSTWGLPLLPTADGITQRACECAMPSTPDAAGSPDGFHLEKKLSSKTVLQESWIMLTRLLSQMAFLPVGTGDKTYHGIENWASRMPVGDMNLYPNHIFERYWVLKFIRQFAAHMPGGNCLEWGDPSSPGHKMHYVHYVSSCTSPFDMQFDFSYWQQKGMAVEGNVVYSDILSLPSVLGPHLKMNTIFATQVFEHVADPLRAATALYEALAPGGALVFTAPQSAPFHKVPHDYYRYTVEGVKYTLIQAGFCAPNQFFTGGGDFTFTIAAEAGLQVQDFSLEEVDGAYHTGFDQISHSAIGIHALAFKAPHWACDDPTAGWAWANQVGIRA